MFLKFVIFIILFVILVRVISNLFLRGSKKNSNASFFYQAFKNVRNQQKNQQGQAQNGSDEPSKNDLDNIEEAEYEDITEEDAKSSSKESD